MLNRDRLTLEVVEAPASAVEAESARPRSATAWATACAGFLAAVASMVLIGPVAWAPERKTLAVVAITAAVMVAFDLVAPQSIAARADAIAQNPVNRLSANRLGRKIIGLAATLAALAAIYAVLPEYAGAFYDPARRAAWFCLPAFIVAAPLYLGYVDRRQRDPEDIYAQIGGLITGQSIPQSWSDLAHHARGWIVKGFFLPLMFVYLVGSLQAFWQTDFAAVSSSFSKFYDFSYNTLLLIDLLFAVVGYTLTLRLLGTHIRSTEPTPLGWVVCLVCYQPFWSVIGSNYLNYEHDKYYWGDVAAGHPLLYLVWGSVILALIVVYAASTVSFGLRFSNLTHRGIITSGPYRWTKHPAYLSKCISFWLISVPFLSRAGLGEALSQSLLLLAANGIYLARAITEERHLARDPVYREYQAYIRQHGLIARLMRLTPYSNRRGAQQTDTAHSP